MSEDVARERIRKISEALRNRAQLEMWEISPTSSPGERQKARARAIAARAVGVNDRYVADALHLHREAPDLFDQVHAGDPSLQAALKTLHGEDDPIYRTRVKRARNHLNAFIRRPDLHPDFMDALEQFLADYAAGAQPAS